MDIYKTEVEWPLLQSKTETKHKSGLFTTSAQFVRPVGLESLPDSIPTSIGAVPIWPDPTVSTGTDGFQIINATGYGMWDNTATETIYNYTTTSFDILAQSQTVREDPANPGEPINPWEISNQVSYKKKIYCLLETATIKKMGDDLPQIPALKILSLSGEDITNKIYNANDEFNLNFFQLYREKETSTIPKTAIISTARLNTYGTIKELEVVCELVIQPIDFGMFSALV